MFAVSQLLWAIVCIHVFWLYCFITGSLVRAEPHASEPDGSRASARSYMAELVINSTTGIAITGFVLLLLGFVGLLNLSALICWLVIEILLFKFIKRENVFGFAFWARRLQSITRAWS
ncbi:MAG TPA: hypothetical protein VMS31_19700, partial [Pyrinomonadaceae bacterium]|nr:hypothetical protein [Pyrinomonadaceae bacterium]